MLANYLAAAMRSLSRDRLHTTITVLSLAIGFSAVILSMAFGRYQKTYDDFWPDHDRIFLIAQWVDWGGSPLKNDAAPPQTAALVAQEVPDIEAVTRLSWDAVDLQHGQVVGSEETLYWADPNFFDVMRRPALSGDIASALQAPGSIVLTRSLAQKYFGDGAAVGQTLLAHRLQIPEPLQLKVTAVIDDLPPNSHLDGKAFVSIASVGGFPLSNDNQDGDGGGAWAPRNDNARTYVRVRPGVDRARLEPAVEAVGKRHLSAKEAVTLKAFPLRKVYLKDPKDEPDGGTVVEGGARQGDHGILIQMNMVAGLILTVGAINFITLMTARGARRAVEVGVRKAAGARRRDLVLQFLGEAVLYAVFAFVLAVALAELAAPVVRAMTEATVAVRYPEDLPFIGALFAGALGVGALAGVYPALALSAYRPAQVLKGGPVKSAGSAWLRQSLIALQFAPLILLALLVTTMTFGMLRGMDLSRAVLADNPLFLQAPCTDAFKTQLRAIPGVRSAGCTAYSAWRSTDTFRTVAIGQHSLGKFKTQDEKTWIMDAIRIPADGFAFHEFKLLAGRLPTQADESTSAGRVFINESALHHLGYAKPEAAVGQALRWNAGRNGEGEAFVSVIEGVVADRAPPDFEEVAYLPTPPPPTPATGVGVRFTQGADRAAAVAAIEGIWKAGGHIKPLDRFFYFDRLDEELQDFWASLRFVFACLAVGVLVGAMGLFGTAAFLAERRTKEIGVRKAMGASRGRVVMLMLREFALPVVLANLISVPAAWAIFTYIQRDRPVMFRMPTGPEVLGPVVVGSILIALASTFIHAWRAASARPVSALRYE